MIRSLLALAVLLGACTATPIPLPVDDGGGGTDLRFNDERGTMLSGDGFDSADLWSPPADAGAYGQEGPHELGLVDGMLDGASDGSPPGVDGPLPDGTGDGPPSSADGLDDLPGVDTGPAPDWELADGV